MTNEFEVVGNFGYEINSVKPIIAKLPKILTLINSQDSHIGSYVLSYIDLGIQPFKPFEDGETALCARSILLYKSPCLYNQGIFASTDENILEIDRIHRDSSKYWLCTDDYRALIIGEGSEINKGFTERLERRLQEMDIREDVIETIGRTLISPSMEILKLLNKGFYN